MSDIPGALWYIGKAVPGPMHHHTHKNGKATSNLYLESTGNESLLAKKIQQMHSQLAPLCIYLSTIDSIYQVITLFSLC